MKTRAIFLSLILLFGFVGGALAQGDSPELSIRLTRDFGYGGFDNKIEGRFSKLLTGFALQSIRVQPVFLQNLNGQRMDVARRIRPRGLCLPRTGADLIPLKEVAKD